MFTDKWIVDPNNFRGNAHNMMSRQDPRFVDFTNPPETFTEYNAKRGGKFKLVDDREFFEDWIKPFENSLQGEWQQTTEDKFFEMLEVLPPEKHRTIEGYETFFMSEYYTGSLSSIYIRHAQTNQCWTSLRDVNIDLQELEHQLKTLK